jgi:hypothetical protein
MNLAIPLGNAKYAFLTNENIRIGDQVFPCISGYHTGNKFYIMDVDATEVLTNPEYVLACTGWPSQPHTVEKFYHDDCGLLHISTDKGCSPSEVYFKVIKPEGETK